MNAIRFMRDLNPRSNIYGNYFLFGCFSGLAISDGRLKNSFTAYNMSEICRPLFIIYLSGEIPTELLSPLIQFFCVSLLVWFTFK